MARLREFDTEAAVEASMNAFCQNGYEGTSIQDLVEATGVGRGSLYTAFGSKEGLYLAAMDRYRERYAVPLIEILRGGAPVRDLLRAVLVGTVDEVVRDGSRHACMLVGAVTERIAHDPKVAAHVHDTTSSLEDALCEVITEAQEQGQLSAERDARDLARFLMTFMQGLRVTGTIDGDRGALMATVEVALAPFDKP
ncbi:TetR/AcrR family transcriptional regulator [Streptomyces sp. NPDC048512]|uniref:TetR/AcrR family transcriptional regulator n=1 Tax=Streptomyces sp. NPDC048512 TaxID=3365563 RepID=UPI00371EA7FF